MDKLQHEDCYKGGSNMMYRSDFSGMMENIDLVVKLLWDVKDRISDRETLIQHNESNVVSINNRIDFKDVPSVETALAEIRTARKLLSETAIELNLGRHYTGREYEDD